MLQDARLARTSKGAEKADICALPDLHLLVYCDLPADSVDSPAMRVDVAYSYRIDEGKRWRATAETTVKFNMQILYESWFFG